MPPFPDTHRSHLSLSNPPSLQKRASQHGEALCLEMGVDRRWKPLFQGGFHAQGLRISWIVPESFHQTECQNPRFCVHWDHLAVHGLRVLPLCLWGYFTIPSEEQPGQIQQNRSAYFHCGSKMVPFNFSRFPVVPCRHGTAWHQWHRWPASAPPRAAASPL